MADEVVCSETAVAPLGDNEFRLKLQFKPSAGPAIRVFQFYADWLEATNSIINEFASHICKGLRIEIKLVEIKEGSADPKFAFEPKLIGPLGQVAIPPELLSEFIPQLHEIVNADLDYLMENVDTNNFEEFFVTKLADLNILSDKFQTLIKGPQQEAPEQRPELEMAETAIEVSEQPAEKGPSDKKEQLAVTSKYNRKKVFSALNQIAKSTSDHLLNGEILTQSSPDGESIDITPELVRSSNALQRDQEETLETIYEQQTVVASRAVMIGNGVWSFLWNGRSRRMQIKDEDWLKKFHSGEVALIAKQSLTVDISETETKFLKMGIIYKKRYKYFIDKIHE